MEVNAVEVKNLQFSFDGVKPVLEDVSFDIKKGGFYSILGPNGSGKTTLLKIISKLLATNGENVLVFGEQLKSIKTKALARRMSIVPQQTTVDFEFSVHDIVRMGRAPHLSRFSTEGTEDGSIVKSAMELTGTWHLREKSINAISGGERQRVIIARAIAQQTEIVLMDEPISHLDIHHQIELLKQMKRLNESEGKTIVAVLHDLNLAAAFSDSVIMMHNGRVHSAGSPETVLNAEAIEQVYGIRVSILKEPSSGKPYILPIL